MSVIVNHDSAAARAVVYVESVWDGARYGGTGVIVGNNDILTSAHLVYNGGLGGFADSTRISPLYVPGTTENEYFQDLSIQFYADYDPNNDRRVVSGDRTEGQLSGSELDIALITTGTSIGDIYGWMEIDYAFSNGPISVLGHPGAYDNYLTLHSGVAYHHDIDNVVMYTDRPELNPGNSGGPIFHMGADGPSVVGLVSTGQAATSLVAHRAWLEDAMAKNNHDPKTGSAMEMGTHANDEWHVEDIGIGFNGLGGHDKIIFDHRSDDVLVSLPDDGDLEIRFKERGEVHVFAGVEELVFLDKTLDVADLSWGGSTDTSDLATLSKLYVAYFDRAPDAEGLEYWTSGLMAGTSLEEICRQFSASEEFSATYGALLTDAPDAFVAAVYENVLGRRPDLDGHQFWSEQVAAGHVSPEVFILSFLTSSAPGSADFDYMQQRIENGSYTVSTLLMGNALSARDEAYADMVPGESGADAAVPLVGAQDGAEMFAI